MVMLCFIGFLTIYTIIALWDTKVECAKCENCYEELWELQQKRIEDIDFNFTISSE